MIYTITFNPALDYVIKVEDFKLGSVNRSNFEEVYAGGKGINVSIVLNNLGVKSKALGYIAGFTGEEIEKRIRNLGCETDFIKVSRGMSRINVKLKTKDETEINGQGPKITEKDVEELYIKLENLQEGDILVLAGSIPNTLPENIYENIMGKMKDKGVLIIVDATKEPLLNVLKYNPFLVKPNHHELSEVFNEVIRTTDDIIHYGKKLRAMGAKNVLISMAGEGAIMITENNEVMKSSAPKGFVKNSVGAGDSVVAGFLAGYIENKDLREAFKMGVATGSASAFSEELATRDEVEKLLMEINLDYLL